MKEAKQYVAGDPRDITYFFGGDMFGFACFSDEVGIGIGKECNAKDFGNSVPSFKCLLPGDS